MTTIVTETKATYMPLAYGVSAHNNLTVLYDLSYSKASLCLRMDVLGV